MKVNFNKGILTVVVMTTVSLLGAKKISKKGK